MSSEYKIFFLWYHYGNDTEKWDWKQIYTHSKWLYKDNLCKISFNQSDLSIDITKKKPISNRRLLKKGK